MNNMRTTRIARGMSQRELADKLGLSPSMLSLYESGKRLMPERVARLVALHLNMPLKRLAYQPETVKPLRFITQARERRGLSVEWLAHQIGVRVSSMLQYERSAIDRLPAPTLEKIAAALSVTPDELRGRG